jgi:outer membrane biosynthesis protein TonB
VTDLEPIEALVKHERWTRDGLDRAAGVGPESPPEGETAAQAFTRRTREQAEAERRDAELERQVAFQNPSAPTAAALVDPLRAVAREQRAYRRRRRRRGRIP